MRGFVIMAGDKPAEIVVSESLGIDFVREYARPQYGTDRVAVLRVGVTRIEGPDRNTPNSRVTVIERARFDLIAGSLCSTDAGGVTYDIDDVLPIAAFDAFTEDNPRGRFTFDVKFEPEGSS